jgi:hypothetical protein
MVNIHVIEILFLSYRDWTQVFPPKSRCHSNTELVLSHDWYLGTIIGL